MTLVKEVEIFVQPYYEGKDLMHNFSHIERVLKLAKRIAKNYQIDNELLVVGAYFHGVIQLDENEVVNFLRTQNTDEERIKKIVQVAWDSQKDSDSSLIEGKILHDAHLLEGGKTFLITKSLITGTARGQSLIETVAYIEENLLGKFECLLPETQKEYEEKETFTQEFLNDLKRNIESHK
jgi:uncharacterized protein